MRSFETWNYEQVEDAFGISPVRTLPSFENWLKAEGCDPDESEKNCWIIIEIYFLKKYKTRMKMS